MSERVRSGHVGSVREKSGRTGHFSFLWSYALDCAHFGLPYLSRIVQTDCRQQAVQES